jgi:hypothetical protein
VVNCRFLLTRSAWAFPKSVRECRWSYERYLLHLSPWSSRHLFQQVPSGNPSPMKG